MVSCSSTFPPNVCFPDPGMAMLAEPGAAERRHTNAHPDRPEEITTNTFLLTISDGKIRRTLKFSRFLQQSVLFARQWNQNVRSSILIMIVTYLQTGANGNSRSSLERVKTEQGGPAHRWLFRGLLEEEVTGMQQSQTGPANCCVPFHWITWKRKKKSGSECWDHSLD